MADFYPSNALPALNLRYPNQVGSAPFEKWMLFEVRAGRHVGRNQILPETGGNSDRTLASVALYLSETALVDSIQVCYDKADLGLFEGAAVQLLAQTGQNLFDTKLTAASFGGNLSSKLKSIAGEGARIISDVAMNTTRALQSHWQDAIKADLMKIAPDAAASITGLRPNPRTDLLFNTQEYRSRELSFLLVPRNIQEAQAINDIIHVFQYYMLPAYLGTQDKVGSFLLGFPYELEISMFQNGSIIENINKIGRSVVTSVTVDHAAGGKVAFVEAEGQLYPVATRLTLGLQEVRLLGRGDKEIERGGTLKLEDPRLK